MRSLSRLIQALVFAIAVLVGHSALAKRDYGSNSGYLVSTAGERDVELKDMPIAHPPASLGPSINERIFNEKLVKEFRDRYDEQFGRTEADRVYNSPNRFSYYDDLFGFKGTPQEENDAKRAYGDFVVRRLLEYHVDNYAQNDPKLRPAWEAKERLKEFKVEVAQFRFDMQYSIAGNTFDMRMVNPYFSLFRLRLQMDPGAFGPAPIKETTFSLGRNLTQKIFVEGHYAVIDGVVTVIERRQLTPALGGTITESTFTKGVGINPLIPRESRYLAGLSYVF
jgi:hypothetical protein